MGQGSRVQGPGPSELSPYQQVTIQFQVIRCLHSLIFLSPAPLPPASPRNEATLHTGDGDGVQGWDQAGAQRGLLSALHLGQETGNREREAGQD